MGQPRNQRGNQEMETNKKWKHYGPKSLGCSKGGSKREVYSNTDLPYEAKKKISNKQPNITPKGATKTTNKTPN